MSNVEIGLLAVFALALFRHRRRLCELVSNTDRTLSHSKLWSNIAYAAATWMFIRINIDGTATTEHWLIYLGVIGGHAAASKWIAINGQRKAESGDASGGA